MTETPTSPETTNAVSRETTQAPEAAGDWRDAIAEPELRQVAEKFTSPRDVVKSYAALQSRLGRSIVKPGAEASAEELAAYHRQLGVPDSPAGYDLSLPESLPEQLRPDAAGEALQQDFAAAMHEAGASNEVVQKALDWYYGTLGQSVAQKERANADQRAETEADLRREWGADHERNLNFAQRAVRDFGDEDFVSLLETREIDGVKLGDHPGFVRAFAAIGRRMGEDLPLNGEPERGGAGLQARIDGLHALQDSDPRRYASNAVQRELQDLYRRLYGSEPIVGDEGRRL